MEIIYFIFGPIYGLIIGKFINKLFKKKTTKEVLELNNERLIELLERSEREKTELQKENARGELEQSSIFDSIRRSGLSIEELIAEYDKPINAILISAYNQRIPDGSIYGKGGNPFLPDELKRFNGKSLGSGVYVIPPKSVPKGIHNSNDLKKWFEEEILNGKYCILKFLILFDIRKKAFWSNYLKYIQTRKRKKNFTIGEALTLEDIFDEKQIAQTTTIAKIIRRGDIGWLAHKHVSEDDLVTLRLNQLPIENKLGKPTLQELAHGNYLSKLKTILEEFNIHNSGEVAKSIIDEAKFWHSRLK